MKVLCQRRWHDEIENPRPGVPWHMKTIGHRARCHCGWVGPDRIYTIVNWAGPAEDRKPMAYHGFDTEKSDKAATLDRTRHLGKLKPKPSAGPKDMQRKKLYAAEDKAFRNHPEKDWVNTLIGEGSIEESGQWLRESVLDQTWFKERWGSRKTKVVPGSGTNASYRGRIMLARWARQPWVILHEMAHVLASPHGEQAHGEAYAAVYVFLVEHALGATYARRLRGEFMRGKVRYKDLRMIPEPSISKAA